MMSFPKKKLTLNINNYVEVQLQEKKNNIERSEHYQGLIDFLQWKFEQITSILETK